MISILNNTQHSQITKLVNLGNIFDEVPDTSNISTTRRQKYLDFRKEEKEQVERENPIENLANELITRQADDKVKQWKTYHIFQYIIMTSINILFK